MAFGKKIRLAYWEARLYLDGDANSHTLMRFGLSRQQATTDIRDYRAINPGATHYCPHRKGWILDRRYKPRLLPREKHAGFARQVDSIYLAAYGHPPAQRRNRKPTPKKIQKKPKKVTF